MSWEVLWHVSPFKFFFVTALIIIAILVSSPMFIEMALMFLDYLGYTSVRHRDDVCDLQELAIKWSDRTEYVITAGTAAGLLTAVYFHVTEIVADLDAPPHHLFIYHIFPSVLINSHVFYFFYQAVTRDAGKPGQTHDAEGGKRCKICSGPRPARAYHCVTCNQCVLFMDHHCPFTSNCVGQENYPFFFGWVMWTSIAMGYALWLCYEPYMHCKSPEGIFSPLCPSGHKKEMLFLLSACFAALVWGFFMFVLFLLVRGQTVRAFLDSEVVDPFSEYRQRGWLFCAQYRLGPTKEWWRYLIPFTLNKRSAYAGTGVI